jgi:integrase
MSLFCGPGQATGRRSPQEERNSFTTIAGREKAGAVRSVGITNFCWHDSRHTYASRLRQTGALLGNIAELLGHKDLAMTKRYAHLSISNLHEAVSRISNSTRANFQNGGEFVYQLSFVI